MAINFYNLPYQKELIELAEAMQYAFRKDQKNDDWFKRVLKRSKSTIAEQIKETKAAHADELASSPILLGLLDMYLDACTTKGPKKLKDIYLKYQNLQKNYPFETNNQAYFDAGCILQPGPYDENTICVMYPIHLYAAYAANGGVDDDHRFGFLFPVHELNDDELVKLHDINSDLFSNKKVRKVYEEIIDPNLEID